MYMQSAEKEMRPCGASETGKIVSLMADHLFHQLFVAHSIL